MPKLTHFDGNGNPNMVDVSQKETTVRIAEASGYVYMEKVTLTAVSVAALTIYDMCKAIDRSMTIDEIKLNKKTGGKSGEWIRKSE